MAKKGRKMSKAEWDRWYRKTFGEAAYRKIVRSRRRKAAAKSFFDAFRFG